jgi:hypothetical protein
MLVHNLFCGSFSWVGHFWEGVRTPTVRMLKVEKVLNSKIAIRTPKVEKIRTPTHSIKAIRTPKDIPMAF